MKDLTKLKNSREFLQNIFPENLLPSLLLNNKEKQKIKVKMLSLKKKLREIENKLIYQTIKSLPYFSNTKLRASLSKITTFPFFRNINKKQSQKTSCGAKNFLTFSGNNFINEKYSITNYFFQKLYQIVKKNYKVATLQNSQSTLFSILKKKIFNKTSVFNLVPNLSYANSFVPQADYDTIIRYYQNNIRYLYSIDQLKYEVTKLKTFSKKFSDFNQQLKEKKKLSIIYGFLPKKQIEKIYNKAFYVKGRTDNNFFFLLEKRLDIVLYRASFFNTIKTVRQFITHKKILVNGLIVNLPNYIINPGDVISVKNSEFASMDYHIKKNIKKFIKSRKTRSLVSNDVIQKLQDFLLFSHKLSYYQKMKSLTYFKNNINIVLTNKKVLHNIGINNEKKNLIFVLSLLKYFKDKNYNFAKNFFFYLKLKEKLFKKRPHRLSVLRFNQIKPLNLEISYKCLTIIFLYSPQKLRFSALLDLDKITRSIK